MALHICIQMVQIVVYDVGGCHMDMVIDHGEVD